MRSRRLFPVIVVATLISFWIVPCVVNAEVGPAPDRAVELTPWAVTAKERDSETWSRAEMITDPATGSVRTRTRQFVAIGTGMNYQDQEGRWQRTRLEFQIAPDGTAVAEFGPHSLAIGRNINSPTAMGFAAGGLALTMAPLAIGYYDPVDGRNLVIATVRDTAGVLTAPNEITFPSAFQNLDASIRITYRYAGISCDLLLHEAPPDPVSLGLSRHCRLELYTEFGADTPLPAQLPRVLRRENDEQLRQQLLEPDFIDHVIDYGAYKMPTGAAFNDAGQEAQTLVAKRFMVLADGRKVLAEAIEYQAAESLFAHLPPMKEEMLAVLKRKSRDLSGGELSGALMNRRHTMEPDVNHPGARWRDLPPRGMAREISTPITKLAAANRPLSKPAFIADYSLLTGGSNVTFLTGNTSTPCFRTLYSMVTQFSSRP